MSWTILNADSLHIPLADNSVQCVVTSPPYWGLRDYGTATWVGGDEGCDHLQDRHPAGAMRNEGRNRAASNGTFHDSPRIESILSIQYRNVCGKCGATRIDSQIGLEKTPEEYVAKIVAVFAEVWRVLRDDGTCWVNLGDSYTTGTGRNYEPAFQDGGAYRIGMKQEAARYKPKDIGLKPKDLVGIPWRVAFALQAAGWYLRSDIIWSKPNPMPESVTDRPTKAHEYIFLLSKKERYFFDQDAVREPHSDTEFTRARYGYKPSAGAKHDLNGDTNITATDFANYFTKEDGKRNIRTVWEISTQPYPEAHFATFPEEIAIRCIKAGSRGPGKRCDCDAIIDTPLGSGEISDPSFVTGRAGYNRPRRPDEGTRPITKGEQRDYAKQMRESGQRAEMVRIAGSAFAHYIRTDSSGARPLPPELLSDWLARGWLKLPAQCNCPTLPGDIVLDPFSGAGTVPLVADKLSRRGIGLELKADYCRMAERRCYDDAPLLAAMEG